MVSHGWVTCLMYILQIETVIPILPPYSPAENAFILERNQEAIVSCFRLGFAASNTGNAE